jgi:hypothetical protein
MTTAVITDAATRAAMTAAAVIMVFLLIFFVFRINQLRGVRPLAIGRDIALNQVYAAEAKKMRPVRL